MEVLVLIAMTIASAHLAAGADNGVWRGADDRPDYIQYLHYHDDDRFDNIYRPHYHDDRPDYIHVNHYPEGVPEPVGMIFPQPDTSPEKGLNVSQPINVFESGPPKGEGFGVGASHDTPRHLAQVGDTATIIVQGDDRDPYYDAIEYETYSEPHYDRRHDHYHDELPYDDDNDYHDHHDYHDYPNHDHPSHHYQEPGDYDEPDYHRRDHIDDEELAERARASFDDEIEQEMKHDHGHYAHELEPDVIVEHNSRPAARRVAVNDHGHDNGHIVDDLGHDSNGHGHVADDLDMIDSEDFGGNHDVIELPSFTTPVAHNSKNDKAVVMIGDVTPAS